MLKTCTPISICIYRYAHTYTYIYTRITYICIHTCTYSALAIVLKSCSFAALPSLDRSPCRLLRHFPPLFSAGEDEFSLLTLPAVLPSSLTWRSAYSALQDIHAARASHVGSIPQRSQHGRPGDDNPVVHFFKNIVSLISSRYALEWEIFFVIRQ